MTAKVLVQSYSAFGSPEFSFVVSDGHKAGLTAEGKYRVAYCGRHSSKRYPIRPPFVASSCGVRLGEPKGRPSLFLPAAGWTKSSPFIVLGHSEAVR